jgi:hypothetical protein
VVGWGTNQERSLPSEASDRAALCRSQCSTEISAPTPVLGTGLVLQPHRPRTGFGNVKPATSWCRLSTDWSLRESRYDSAHLGRPVTTPTPIANDDSTVVHPALTPAPHSPAPSESTTASRAANRRAAPGPLSDTVSRRANRSRTPPSASTDGGEAPLSHRPAAPSPPARVPHAAPARDIHTAGSVDRARTLATGRRATRHALSPQ